MLFYTTKSSITSTYIQQIPFLNHTINGKCEPNFRCLRTFLRIIWIGQSQKRAPYFVNSTIFLPVTILIFFIQQRNHGSISPTFCSKAQMRRQSLFCAIQLQPYNYNYNRGLKLKLTRGPHETQRKVSRAALKISEKITF